VLQLLLIISKTTPPQKRLQLSANQLSVFFSAERLRSLYRSTDSTVNNELRKNTQSTGNTEEDCVVIGLSQAIVLEKDTGVLRNTLLAKQSSIWETGKPYSINVGVRVLGFSVLSQDTRGNIVDLANELEHRIIRKLLEREFTLGHVAGVGLPQDGVAVARNNTTSVQGGPEVILNGLVAEVVADSFLHLAEPVQNFLVGQSVERTSKAVQTSSKGEHRGAESRSDQVSGVSRNITTLLHDISVGSLDEWSREITYVIRMDNEVQPH